MQILFLGTSHGSAEKGRFRTSMLLETQKGSYFVDLGAPIGGLMKNYDRTFDNVRAAFITHMHDDHAISIPEYACKCNYLPDERYLYLPDESDVAAVDAWLYAMHCEDLTNRGLCKSKVVREGLFYDDGNLKMTAIPTRHLNRGHSFAYVAEAEGKTVLFTGDLSSDFSDFPQFALEHHLNDLVCELTHFDVEHALPLLRKVKADRIIFNHVRADRIEMLRKNDEGLVYHIASDGDVIVV